MCPILLLLMSQFKVTTDQKLPLWQTDLPVATALCSVCQSVSCCIAGAARATHMAWNWVQLQQVLLDSPAVRLVLSGHDHIGGYAQHGHIHFVTVEAMLEGKH